MYTSYKNELANLLQEKSDLKAKNWWENYVKGSAPFLGVKMGDIRSIVHRWHKVQIAGNLELNQQVGLALALFEGEYTEEKLAGTLFLQEILLPADGVDCERDLDRLATLFTDGSIYDWNVCDWFCIKVLGSLIKKGSEPCALGISAWRSSSNLWQARASLVAFVPVAEKAEYYPLIKSACRDVIKRRERFAKTAVGWILREISIYDNQYVKRVVKENISHFSSESLNNALKYFPADEKVDFRQLMKDAKIGENKPI
jgi:3-methyladenine DNA glycosylase AlkD